MEFTPPFGKWLKSRRQQLGLTQAALARQAGCAEVTLYKLEAGERRPSRQFAERLAECLDLPEQQWPAFASFATGMPEQPQAGGRGNVPAPVTPVVGRAADLARARHWLRSRETRLVTLVGPPGVGKTRLAIEVAVTQADRYADGAWFVALAAITDPDGVLPAIAAVLGLRLEPDQPVLEGLKRYLRDRRLLMVLDNCEQVRTAAPQVAELLAAAPGLQVLATSRAPLRITGEQELPVPPLALPAQRREPRPEALARCASVELFTQRARAVQPGFELNRDNAPVISELCHCLDGLPLAIELAAARIKLLTPAALLAGLQPHATAGAAARAAPASSAGGEAWRFELLSDGPRDRLPRQRTLWNTLEWSYRLLSGEEQELFRRMGAFVGGGTLDAIQAMVDDSPPVSQSLISNLQSLIDHSLVQQVEGSDGEGRYTMLELIRDFAMHQLAASGRAEAVRRRHAAYFTRLARQGLRPPTYEPLEGCAWAKRADAEFGNLQAALEWCQRADEPSTMELALAAALAVSLRFYVLTWGYHTVTDRLMGSLDRALKRGRSLQPAVYIPLLHCLSRFPFIVRNEPARMKALAEECLALYRQLGDRAGEAAVLCDLGRTIYHMGDYEQGEHLANDALRLWRMLGDEENAANTLYLLGGGIALEQNRLPEARAYLEQARSIWQRLSVKHCEFGGTLDADMVLGLVAQLEGDAERAVQLEEACLREYRAGNVISAVMWTLYYLGRALLMQSQVDRGMQCLREAISYSLDFHHDRGVALGLDEIASARWAQGHIREAVVLVAAADRIRRAFAKMTPVTCLAVDHERMLALVRARMDDPAIAAAWAEGQAMSQDEAVDAACAREPGLL
jgi:predicted ATPase/DNA-binding XRE family transcriptional regulator